jgi:putative FmdB family regulatory protein
MKYGYYCKNCNKNFEITLPVNHAKEDIKCPYCNNKEVVKLFFAPNIVFKGTGFYKNDSKIKDDRK